MFAPGGIAFAGERENGSAILIDEFGPGRRSHLRKVNSTEAHASNKYIYAIAYGLVFQ